MKSRKILEAEGSIGCKFDDLHYYLQAFDKESRAFKRTFWLTSNVLF